MFTFIPRYLSILSVILNGIVFLIYLSAASLVMYRNATDFFLKIFMFLFERERERERGRERERQCEQGRGRERGRQRI